MQLHKIALVVLLYQIYSLQYGHCLHLPEVPSLGDFMEYYLTVPLSCSNVTDAEGVTDTISKRFAVCTRTIVLGAQDTFGHLELICEKQGDYLQCWDQLKQDLATKCRQNGRFPAVYAATVKSLCGNDRGNKTIDSLKRALATTTEQDLNDCPEETGIHWLKNCKSLLESMISENVCDRQAALDECLGKITCLNVEGGRLQKQIYSNGRHYLNCGS